ncbi:aminopeptidase P family N-terminal domain-containing protein, partial [Phytoactinopolyspora endophytica]|uniref:aminopeptidase P family N-terminal domain-containing protein n=1 Tax=Phytoactinopolyspora endophytica TaxID=1642495 RepID=UPI00197C5478
MPELHAARRERFAAHLAEHEIPAALLTRLVNVQYLTGLSSSNAAVLVTADGTATLATDGRYATAAATVAPDVELVVIRGVAVELAKRAAERGFGRLAVEEHDVTMELSATIRSELDDASLALELVRLGRAVEDLRAVKDESEIDSLRSACAIS